MLQPLVKDLERMCTKYNPHRMLELRSRAERWRPADSPAIHEEKVRTIPPKKGRACLAFETVACFWSARLH